MAAPQGSALGSGSGLLADAGQAAKAPACVTGDRCGGEALAVVRGEARRARPRPRPAVHRAVQRARTLRERVQVRHPARRDPPPQVVESEYEVFPLTKSASSAFAARHASVFSHTPRYGIHTSSPPSMMIL